MLIIDGDAITYICSKDTLDNSIEASEKLLKSVFNYLSANEYYMFLSNKPYFRNNIDPNYKAHRKPIASLIYLKEIKKHLIDNYNAQVHPPFEADDLVAYTKKIYPQSIILSTDKDVLKTIPGSWFNYKAFQRGFTTEHDALKFLYIQCLMGDAADNVKGVPGIGAVKASKIIEPLATEGQMINACFNTYHNYYKDEIQAFLEFQKNLRLVKMLSEDSDYIKYGGYVPDIGHPSIYRL